MDISQRSNVQVFGKPDGQPMVFSHGFGCDQGMWRFVWPAFADRFRIVLFDHVGHGGSSSAHFTPERYATLHDYARDVLEIVHALELEHVVFVGHSVSCMIGALAAVAEPERFARLVMVAPSPRYLDDGDYTGGFSTEDVDGLLSALRSNHVGWSGTMAPTVMGNPDRPELAEELEGSFCAMDPAIAAHFARVTFLSDNRADLREVQTPALVLQCSDDSLAPAAVGTYVHRQLAGSVLHTLRATGHCPNLSAPQETVAAIEGYLRT